MTHSNPIIIGLCGRARSGKTTAAQFLRENYDARTLAFAQPLKDAMSIIFPDISRETFDTSAKDSPSPADSSMQGYTPRELMQVIGSELFRNTLAQHFPRIGGNIWARAVGAQIDKLRNNPNVSLIVIEDIRFPNESQVVLSRGGHILYIDNPRIVQSSASHTSEQFDATSLCASHTISNDGTIAKFYDELRTKLNSIRIL